jgi:hypothetical protein
MVARICIGSLTILAVLLLGLNHIWHNSPASKIAPFRTGDDPATVAFEHEVEEAYENKGLDYMESWAESLRRDESRVANGDSRLFHFYSVLASIDCQCRDGTRMVHSFDDRRVRLEAWLKKYPDSTTAILAIGALWEYRAWQVVGGIANENPLSDAQKREFRNDLERAWSYNQRLKISDDPYVAFFRMRVLEYGDLSEAQMTQLFQESTAAWPRHYQIYFLYAQILPWLYNDRASEIQLMRDLAAAKDDENKQVGLSYIVGSMFRGFPFEEWKIPWPSVKHAYEVRRKLYGWSNRNLNAFCYLAIEAEDWPTAQDCMRQINGHWDDVVWTSQNDFVWNELVVSLH